MLDLERCRVDLDRGTIRYADGTDGLLTSRERELLCHLAARPGAVLSRDDLHVALWGAGRAVVTRALDNTVQRLRQKIGDRMPAPRHLLTVYGEGYTWLPLERPAPGRGLPPERDRYVGRARESEQLALALARPGAVCLTGPTGVGKTRTALRAARAADQAVWVRLMSARSAPECWAALAAGLGATPGDARAESLIGAVLRRLGSAGRLLLVLDNVEQILEPIREICPRLTGAAPGLTLLLTSRQAAGLPGERVIRMGPLPTRDAIELLTERAGLPEPIAGQVASGIVSRLDGLPLAIELAARRLPLLPADQLLLHMDDRFRLLRSAPAFTGIGATERTRAGSEAQGVLWQTLEWSWELLDPPLRALLGDLSVLPGAFDLPLAAAVAALDPAEAADGLSALQDRSLLQITGDHRLLLYEGVRSHARSRADTAPATCRLISRMRDQARRWLSAVEGPDGPMIREEMARYHEPLTAALESALALRDPAAVPICLALHPVRSGIGALEPWLVRLRSVHTLMGDTLSCSADAAILQAEGEAALLLGRPTEAEASFRQAISALAAHPLEAAVARVQLGNLLRVAGRHADALAALEEALRVLDDIRAHEAQPTGPEAQDLIRWRGAALGHRSATLALLGRLEEATAAAEQAAALLCDRPRIRAIVLNTLGIVHLRAHRPAASLACFEEAITLQRRWPDRRTLALLLINRGALYLELGRLGEAEGPLLEAMEIAQQIGDRRLEATSRADLGIAALDRHRWGEAESLLRAAAAILSEVGDPVAASETRGKLAIALLFQGFAEDALRDAARAADLARQSQQGDLAELWQAWADIARQTRPLPPACADPAIRAAISLLRGDPADPAQLQRSVNVRLAREAALLRQAATIPPG